MRIPSSRTYGLLTGLTLSLGFAVCLLFWMIYFPVLVDPTPGLEGAGAVVFSRRANQESAQVHFSRSNLEMLQAFKDTFQSVTEFRPRNVLLSRPAGSSETLPGAEVSPGFFTVFGVEAGQWNRLASGPGSRDLVVLSPSACGRLGLDRENAVGSIIGLDGRPVQVAGVLPEGVRWPGFLFPDEPEVFRLWETVSDSDREQPAGLLAARLADGQNPTSAVTVLLTALRVDRSGVAAERIEAKTLDDWARQSARWLSALFFSGLVLLTGVFLNVVVLLLGQTLKVIDNWTIRRALGAGEGRLLFDLAKRVFVLSVLASGIGLGLALFLRHLALSFKPGLAPALVWEHLVVVAMSALALASGGALLCGAVPLLVIRRRPMASLLNTAPSESPLGRRMGRVLVFTELAATCCLLVIGVAVVQKYWEQETLDLGFDYANLLVVQLDSPLRRGERGAAGLDLAAIRSRLESLPDVSRTAVSLTVPLSSFGTTGTRVAPWDDPNRGRELNFEDVLVSPEYFAVLRMPLQGRPPKSKNQVVVSQSLARDFWGDGDRAVGRRLTVGKNDYLVSGVVGERARGFSDLSLPAIYRYIGETAGRLPALLIRTDGTKERMVREIATDAAQSLGPDVLVRVSSVAELRSNLLATPKFLAAAFGLLAALMTVVALVCVFAAVNREVTQRRREIAIRRALGARRRTICRQLLAELYLFCVPAMALGGWIGLEALSRTHRQLGVASLDLEGVALAMLLTLAAVGCASLPPLLSASRENQARLLKST